MLALLLVSRRKIFLFAVISSLHKWMRVCTEFMSTGSAISFSFCLPSFLIFIYILHIPLLPFEQFKDMIIFMFIEQTTVPGREIFWFRHKHLPPKRERKEQDQDYLQNDYGIWIKLSVWAVAKYSHFTSIAFLVPQSFFVQSHHFISAYANLQSIFDLALFISNGTEWRGKRNFNHTHAGEKADSTQREIGAEYESRASVLKLKWALSNFRFNSWSPHDKKSGARA